MTRRIMLELAPDTTEEFCGSCKWYEDAMCHQWHRVAYNERRISECLTAESRAARIVDIDPADAARYIQWRDTFAPHPANVDRLEPIDDAMREHAKKAAPR